MFIFVDLYTCVFAIFMVYFQYIHIQKLYSLHEIVAEDVEVGVCVGIGVGVGVGVGVGIIFT